MKNCIKQLYRYGKVPFIDTSIRYLFKSTAGFTNWIKHTPYKDLARHSSYGEAGYILNKFLAHNSAYKINRWEMKQPQISSSPYQIQIQYLNFKTPSKDSHFFIIIQSTSYQTDLCYQKMFITIKYVTAKLGLHFLFFLPYYSRCYIEVRLKKQV